MVESLLPATETALVAQSKQALAPTAPEYEFAGHATHVAAAVAPILTENVPAPQSAHAALPALVLYFPATHKPHAPGSPVLPAAQSNWHAAKAELPAGETPPAPHDVHAALAPVTPDHVPAAQSVHVALPLLVLDLPATHAEHTPPSAPVNPALQVQIELSFGEMEFKAQLEQVVDPKPEYVLTGHIIQ